MKYEPTGKAKAMIDFMGKNPGKDWFNAVELAEVGKTLPASISGFLKAALTNGHVFTCRDGKRRLYGLRPGNDTPEPVNAEPADLDGFSAALWNDGDLIVYGATANEDGSITLNRQQAGQLRRMLCGSVV